MTDNRILAELVMGKYGLTHITTGVVPFITTLIGPLQILERCLIKSENLEDIEWKNKILRRAQPEANAYLQRTTTRVPDSSSCIQPIQYYLIDNKSYSKMFE
ncbi:hypothetical protein KW787_04005 [Candidatus Pacearchaeota archaeon]|nr:hypothetical protein [Candidatus Pacearchaeota archaeon]